MSALAKAFQFFSGLGTVATTSLVTTFSQGREIKLSTSGIRQIKETESSVTEIVSKVDLRPQEVMQEVAKIMGEEGDLKCFWLPDQKVTELLMCAYMDKLSEPVLFHYDVKNQLGRGKIVKRVEQISFSSSPSKMQFANRETFNITRTARPYLATRLPKEQVTWIPKENCKIEKQGRNHQLICFNKSLGTAELDSLSKNNRYQEALSGKSK